MKVLLISPLPPPLGGIASWTENILSVKDMSSSIQVFHLNSAIRFRRITSKSKFIRLLSGIVDTLLLFLSFISRLLLDKPDLIHLTSSASWALYKDYVFVCFAKIFKMKVIIHWHFGRIPDILASNTSECNLFLKIIRKIDYSIVIDPLSLKALSDIGISNLKLIPNPCSTDVSKLASVETINSNLRKKGVLYVGHVVKSKGVFELVDLMLELPANIPLILVGPYEESIKQSIDNIATKRNRLGQVVFAGPKTKDEVLYYMHEYSIFCLPSYTEGFPNVILEAMACGCPIVASRVGAIPMMLDIQSTYPAGVCYDLFDSDTLKKSICDLLYDVDKSNQLGANGKKIILERYTLRNVYPQLLNLWKMLE